MKKEIIKFRKGTQMIKTHTVKVTFENDAEWKEHRADGIGGSEAPVLLGMNKYQTPLQWYRRKKGIDPEPETNEAMMRGHFLEDGVAQYFSFLTGFKIFKNTAPNIVYYDERAPWRRVTPDRFGIDGAHVNTADPSKRFILECKTHNGHIRFDEETGTYKYPEMWKVQVMLGLGICGCKVGYIAWLDSDVKVCYERIDFDQAYYDAICSVMDSYWDMLQNNIEPEASNGSDVVIKFPKQTEGKQLNLDDKALDLIADIQLADEKLKALKEENDARKEKLKLLLADAESAADSDGNVRCTFKTQNAFDEARLKAEEPEVYSKYLVSSFNKDAYKKSEGGNAYKKYCTAQGSRVLKIK